MGLIRSGMGGMIGGLDATPARVVAVINHPLGSGHVLWIFDRNITLAGPGGSDVTGMIVNGTDAEGGSLYDGHTLWVSYAVDTGPGRAWSISMQPPEVGTPLALASGVMG